ncbi:MAG: hypothetical protein [Malazfec virus 5]
MDTTATTTENSKAVERKAGKASTIKSFKGVVRNLQESGLVDKKDYETIKALYQKVVKQYMGEELL